ncbi:MAG: helix-turn-helix domain-containing protein [Actinomycetota bacterium]|nr:helix-turn-helix domain-containing protein [Actinomycetota bacterium]
MSRPAIAAVFARDELAGGERLVAFSLASFAGRDDRAWPGASVAAARAGLSRSRYLMVRDRLVERGLVVVESEASGRGRSSLLALPFVALEPWWEAEINAELFEAVLSRTRRRGPARLLLAAMAALATRTASCPACPRRSSPLLPASRIERTGGRVRSCSSAGSSS